MEIFILVELSKLKLKSNIKWKFNSTKTKVVLVEVSGNIYGNEN